MPKTRKLDRHTAFLQTKPDNQADISALVKMGYLVEGSTVASVQAYLQGIGDSPFTPVGAEEFESEEGVSVDSIDDEE